MAMTAFETRHAALAVVASMNRGRVADVYDDTPELPRPPKPDGPPAGGASTLTRASAVWVATGAALLLLGAISGAGYYALAPSVQALRAGADMVLFGASPSTVSGRTTRVVRAIVNVVGAGTLSRTRLRVAVVHVRRAKHVNLCG